MHHFLLWIFLVGFGFNFTLLPKLVSDSFMAIFWFIYLLYVLPRHCSVSMVHPQKTSQLRKAFAIYAVKTFYPDIVLCATSEHILLHERRVLSLQIAYYQLHSQVQVHLPSLQLETEVTQNQLPQQSPVLWHTNPAPPTFSVPMNFMYLTLCKFHMFVFSLWHNPAWLIFWPPCNILVWLLIASFNQFYKETDSHRGEPSSNSLAV